MCCAALDDTLHVTQRFYHSALFSPDASETCSSWNLSPYPPLLDMTKPSTLLQASCSGTGTPESRIEYNAPHESTGLKPATRRAQPSRLRHRIPHVSHFSVSQTAPSSKTSGNARNLQSSSLTCSRTTSRLGQQSNGSAGHYAHSKLHVDDTADRRSCKSSMECVNAARAVTLPTAHQVRIGLLSSCAMSLQPYRDCTCSRVFFHVVVSAPLSAVSHTCQQSLVTNYWKEGHDAAGLPACSVAQSWD